MDAHREGPEASCHFPCPQRRSLDLRVGAAVGLSRAVHCTPGIFLVFCAVRQQRVIKCVPRVTFPAPQIRRPRVHPPGLCGRAGRAAADALASRGRESRPGRTLPLRPGRALPSGRPTPPRAGPWATPRHSRLRCTRLQHSRLAKVSAQTFLKLGH